MSIRLVTPGLSWAAADLGTRVRHRGLELLPDHVEIVEDPDRALRRARGRRHLLRRLLQVHDPRTDLGVDTLRDLERLAEPRVEARGDVAGELEVLALVVADRDDVGLVQQDVAGHQHRIGEERGGDELVRVGLVLELRHPASWPKLVTEPSSHAASACAATWLCTNTRRAVGIEAGREQHRRQVERLLMEVLGVVARR